jgi:hypothetical protein
VLNLVAEPGETAGFSAERHLHVLAQHAPGFTVHEVVVDAERVPSDQERDQLRRTAKLLNAQVRFADVSRPGTPLHDPSKLSAALKSVVTEDNEPAASPVTAPMATESEPQQAGAGGAGHGGPRGDDAWR